jgi:hypothetical protein
VKLETKTRLLYWSITALFVIPALVLACLALVSYHIPPSWLFRDRLGKWLVKCAMDLSHWRLDACERFYLLRKNGYLLTLKD